MIPNLWEHPKHKCIIEKTLHSVLQTFRLFSIWIRYSHAFITSFNFRVFAFAFMILFASEPLRISLKYNFLEAIPLNRYKNLPYRVAIVHISAQFLCYFLKMFNLILVCSVNDINIGCKVTLQGFQKKLSLSKLMIEKPNSRLITSRQKVK